MKYIFIVNESAGRGRCQKILFNWELGRDLVQKKAEERWGAGVVEQVSLDLRREFPGANDGYSAGTVDSVAGGSGQRAVPGPNGERGSTREFGESSGVLYAGGGGGGGANKSDPYNYCSGDNGLGGSGGGGTPSKSNQSEADEKYDVLKTGENEMIKNVLKGMVIGIASDLNRILEVMNIIPRE